jgi:hypothetical protein
MIVSHKHKFIFVKTTKTAGTSIEIALSRHCGPADIITPISPEDEVMRLEAGGRPPQNYHVPLRRLAASDWKRLLQTRTRRHFRNHNPASVIRHYVGEATWHSYYKFSIERDPFDKAISRYYWSTKPPRPPLHDYLMEAPATQLSNWHIYTIDNTIAVDFVIRYERLREDLEAVAGRIGLQGSLDLPRAKGGHREQRAHYSQMLDPASRSRLELICANEIAAFGYHWREPDNSGTASDVR